MAGRSPFRPDKTHLHHLFIDMGFSHLGAALFILFLNLLVVASWFAAYQNTVFSPARACMRGSLSHEKTVKASFLYVAASLAACLVSIPGWEHFGYL